MTCTWEGGIAPLWPMPMSAHAWACNDAQVATCLQVWCQSAIQQGSLMTLSGNFCCVFILMWFKTTQAATRTPIFMNERDSEGENVLSSLSLVITSDPQACWDQPHVCEGFERQAEKPISSSAPTRLDGDKRGGGKRARRARCSPEFIQGWCGVSFGKGWQWLES